MTFALKYVIVYTQHGSYASVVRDTNLLGRVGPLHRVLRQVALIGNTKLPTYEYICPNCQAEYDIFMTISQFTRDGQEQPCESCGDAKLQRHYRTPNNFTIPANMTYNGIAKTSGGTGKKQQSRVPINIIDEKPGGGYKVTRIGSKADINNE